MHLNTSSPELRSPEPGQERDTLLPFSPTSLDDSKSPADTRESWIPNRRVSDSPTPPDADPADAMSVPSPMLLDSLRLLRSLLLPLVAIAYIVFCYTVHYKTVAVRSGGFFDDSPNNIGMSIYVLFVPCALFENFTSSCDKVRCDFNQHYCYWPWAPSYLFTDF